MTDGVEGALVTLKVDLRTFLELELAGGGRLVMSGILDKVTAGFLALSCAQLICEAFNLSKSSIHTLLPSSVPVG